jgi:tetratricopeptide (TPR) repeat protein
MKPHAFIAMPFGVKPGPDGQDIDFDAVHRELLAPALVAAGCEPLRADQELAAGDIRTDMFQELLVADLVLADLTLDNPNVWYELGVRHALRDRGVVLVQGPRPTNPFDTYTDRKLRYHLRAGRPDPAHLEADRAAIADMVRETLHTPTRRKVSPVYKLLPHLAPPQWQQLMLAEANEWSEAHRAWRERMDTARLKNRPGDILLLAGETPTRSLRVEAQREAGAALLRLGHAGFALEQFDAALAIHPGDLPARQARIDCLSRLGLFEEAQTAVESLTQDHPRDPAAWLLAGRVAEQRWLRRWRTATGDGGAGDANVALPTGHLREQAAEEDALLEAAAKPCAAAFATDCGHHRAGVQALTLALLRQHLGAELDTTALQRLAGGAQWACNAALQRDDGDAAALVSAARLAMLLEPLPVLRRRLKSALAAVGPDWLALDDIRQTLVLLAELGLRPEETASALALVQRELQQARAPVRPRRVVLFSGHMMDAPQRPVPRFAPALEPAAAQAIEAELAHLATGPEDLALCQAAAGGDLLFLEACQRRGMHVQVLLPLPEAEFIDRSVRFAQNGDDWALRYYAVQAGLKTPPRVLADELGPGPGSTSVFERCNQWLLHTALAWGVERLHFVCLWDGGGGDGPGGTAHMVQEVRRRTGRVLHIDVRQLAPQGPAHP